MKKILLLCALVCASVVANAFTMDDIKNWTGTGSKRAALVMQWNANGETNAMAFGYKFDDDKATGADMVLAIAENNPRSECVSSTRGYRVYITGFKLYANNNGSFDDAEDYVAQGWSTSGYWGYFLKSNFADADGTYSGVGCSSRVLSDGCVDGWNWGNGTVTWKEIVSAPSNITTGVEAQVAEKTVASVKYYNLQGVASAEPFSGVNIVVTTYSDGSHKTVKKVIK